MEKYAEEIRPYGHYVSIRYSPAEKMEHGHGSVAASIKMEIYLNSNSAKSGDYPYISFSASEHSKKVGISVSTIRPGSGGSTDNSNRDLEFPLLTTEFIEQHIMDGVSAIFKNKY